MTDHDVQDAVAKAGDMVDPAFLAASMIDERAADIVEALNDMPPERPIAPLKSSTSRGWNANQNS